MHELVKGNERKLGFMEALYNTVGDALNTYATGSYNFHWLKIITKAVQSVTLWHTRSCGSTICCGQDELEHDWSRAICKCGKCICPFPCNGENFKQSIIAVNSPFLQITTLFALSSLFTTFPQGPKILLTPSPSKAVETKRDSNFFDKFFVYPSSFGIIA